MNALDRRKVETAIFAERVVEFGRSIDDLRRRFPADTQERQPAVAVVGLLREKPFQTQLRVEWVGNIEGSEPLGINPQEFGGVFQVVCHSRKPRASLWVASSWKRTIITPLNLSVLRPDA